MLNFLARLAYIFSKRVHSRHIWTLINKATTPMPTFILNDEATVNSYGFRIQTDGIDTTRFDANPVMLDSHFSDNKSVLGKWVNLTKDGGKLKADDEFDEQDAEALRVKGKVDRGYIRGASMGILMNPKDLKMLDGVPTLPRCELLEASIVAVPSNAASLVVFSYDGQKLSEDELKTLTLSVQEEKHQNFNKTHMEKLILTAMALQALGLTVTPEDSSQLNTAIEAMAQKYNELSAAKNVLQGKYDALEATIQAQAEKEAKDLIDLAVTDGRILEAERAEYEGYAKANLGLTKKLLASKPAKESLSGQVREGTAAQGAVKSMDDFAKLSVKEQLDFKTSNPEAYKALFA